MSTFRQGRAAAGTERELRRSFRELLDPLLLGRQRISAGLSQILCEALSMNGFYHAIMGV